VARVGWGLAVVLVIGDRRSFDRAGVQPLHRAPADPRGEERQYQRYGSAAAEKGDHGTNIIA
jgi:hypothetical protein